MEKTRNVLFSALRAISLIRLECALMSAKRLRRIRFNVQLHGKSPGGAPIARTARPQTLAGFGQRNRPKPDYNALADQLPLSIWTSTTMRGLFAEPINSACSASLYCTCKLATITTTLMIRWDCIMSCVELIRALIYEFWDILLKVSFAVVGALICK